MQGLLACAPLYIGVKCIVTCALHVLEQQLRTPSCQASSFLSWTGACAPSSASSPTQTTHLVPPTDKSIISLLLQSSGFGVKGSVGRCYPIWSAFEKCLATADHFKECMDFRDDYVECLHHRKEVRACAAKG